MDSKEIHKENIPIGVIGVSHQTADVQIRERIVLNEKQQTLIIQKLSKRYRIDTSEIEGSVTDFIHEMVKENILSPAKSGDGSGNKQDQKPKSQEDGNPDEYSTPVLEKFTDMADLLLLDPIHEVDESGWPNIPPEPPDAKP